MYQNHMTNFEIRFDNKSILKFKPLFPLLQRSGATCLPIYLSISLPPIQGIYNSRADDENFSGHILTYAGSVLFWRICILV